MSPVFEQQSPEDKAYLETVCKSMDKAEPTHRQWRKKANHYYALYRNYNDWRKEYVTANPRGKDELRRQAKNQWHAELFIPWCFSVVETVVPRMLSQRPRMLVEPADPESEDNAKNMRYLIDRQQENIDYEMVLQEIAKTGLIYGLAVQKVWWREDWKNVTKLLPSDRPATDRQSAWQQATMREKIFDDPDAESVDPFDFFYDPFSGSKLKKCGFVVQRSWRDMKYIKEQAEAGRWRNCENLESIEGGGDKTKYDEIWSARMKAAGMVSTNTNKPNMGLHEVLEFHDGDKVIVVLDRERVVQAGDNPFWHKEYPFQVFRPSLVPNQIAGIGEVEPIEDLQEEINTLRSQRRDNAKLVLQKTFAYMDGMVEPDDLVFGPGKAIPVTGDPRELLFPIPVGDVPFAGYQEEDRLSADIERTTGISESVTGSLPSGATATGVQLVQAAAGERIKNKSRRMEREIAKPGAKQFGSLNQQRILTNRDVRVETPPAPNEPERRWSWRQLGPAELAGNFVYETDGGSMEPENVPQKMQEADSMWTMFQNNPNVDQQKLVTACLERLGVKQPENWLRPPEATVPAAAIDIATEQLVANGAKPDQAKALMAQSVAQALQEQGGPPAPSNSSPGPAQPAPVPA